MNPIIGRVCAALLAALLVAGAPAWAAKAGAAGDKPAAEKRPLPQVGPDTPPDQLALRLSPLTEEDLAAEAVAWQMLLKAKTQEVVALRIALRDAQGDEASRLTEALLPLSAERGALSSGLAEVLQAWEAKGGDPEKIEPLRRYVAAAAAEQIKGARAATVWAEFAKWLSSKDGGIALASNAAIFLIALAVLWVAARILSAVVRRMVARVPNLSALLRDFVSRAAFWSVIAAGLLIVLATLGVHVGGLLALVGGASFVIAFAMQSTLSNFAAGLMIMIYRPFDVGDEVEVAGASGRVASVSLVSTTITTPDNRIVVIPNGNVWGTVITNATGAPTRRVDLEFTVGRNDDVMAAQRILQDVLAGHPLVLGDPAPVVRLQAFGESSVRFGCEAWTKTADYRTVRWEITERVRQRLDAEGVANGEIAAPATA